MYSIQMTHTEQQDLFEEQETAVQRNAPDHYLSGAFSPVTGNPDLEKIFELSVDAYYAILHAQMSELPIRNEISRYIEKVCKAGINTNEKSINRRNGNDRSAAEKAAFDRGDPDVLAVLKAAYKVQHEIHRLTGLLRFSPNDDGVYVAYCSPDHFILPALAEHFTLRFGETPWAIIDEKRKLCLCGETGGSAKIIKASKNRQEKNDSWEDLWRLYHRSVSIENRKNPGLQRQFMPERYHKYLPELKNKPVSSS